MIRWSAGAPRTWSMFSSSGARASCRSSGVALTVTEHLLVAADRSGWLGGSVADPLADEDDVDAAGQFGVDLQDLPDLAVLSVGSLRAGVFQRQAVGVDPLVRRGQRGHQLLRANHEDDLGRAPGVGGQLAARRRRDHQRAVGGDGVYPA